MSRQLEPWKEEELADQVTAHGLSHTIESERSRDGYDFVAAWIVANFPDLTEAELKIHVECNAESNDGRRLCEECGTVGVSFTCTDCTLALCFRCTDAIHIIPSLATHTIRFDRSNTREPLAQAPATARAKASRLYTLPSPQPAPRRALATGTHVFFHASECSRWSRELLHGTLITQEAATVSRDGTLYHRVLYLRGVETLPNGSFRANLTLPGWHVTEGDFETYWPLAIGVFSSQLEALRAVVKAEQIARGKFRREREGGRLERHEQCNVSDGTRTDAARSTRFPTSSVLREILTETAAALRAVPLSRQEDAKFYHELSQGTWHFREWMEAIGCAASLREEDAVRFETDACVSGDRFANTAVGMPWAPMTRIRYFLIAQQDLIVPAQVGRRHLEAIVHRLLLVTVGFAWRCWRDYVSHHRARQETQERDDAARVLQAWTRRVAKRRREKERLGGQKMAFEASIDALELHERRQLGASKVYAFLLWQRNERMRRGMQRWRQASAPCASSPVAAPTWHPSHGMKKMLSRLPRIGARRRLAQDERVAGDSQVVIEDMAAYRLFQEKHTGPADTSYWVLRARVLAGTCPVGPAFHQARRLVSRTDFATTILLQQISVFVCFMTREEVARFATDDVGGDYERQVRTKYDALCRALKGAETVSKRSVAFAQHELDAFDAKHGTIASGDLETKDVGSDERMVKEARETLEQKLQVAKQQAAKASRAFVHVGSMQLEILSFPIPHDGVPDRDELMAFLDQQLDPRLRDGKNLYIFSRLGHGRTGLVAALLLGRLYGITAADALERAQAVHDCRRPHAPRGVSFCSPSTALQLYFVRHALARYVDPIYVPLMLENTNERFCSTRVQQRGLLAEPYMDKDGFMVSVVVDESARERQELEQSASAALQREQEKRKDGYDVEKVDESDRVDREGMVDMYDTVS